MNKRVDDLVGGLCGAVDHSLAPFLRQWCQDSRPFLAFAQAHEAKIRKKVRLAASEEERGDLLAELAFAALLVKDRRFSVLYEPYLATGQRGPDLGVTFKTHTLFHVEVTRLRLLEAGDPGGNALKLARVVCEKIGQLPPGAGNLLAVFVPPEVASGDLAATAIRLLDRAPAGGAGSPAPGLRPEALQSYLRGRQRLSALALCSLGVGGRPQNMSLWLGPQARHPLPPEVSRYLLQTA
ncbi:hypothetical protein Dcar01_01254 [Deinococcus carri]|uniref:Uncharacterized protein n=1 Tax=Deinococcus carri TaxID=1211323 RepID=A0ABP9W7S8_9DEIO